MDDAARHIEIAFEIAKAYDADVDMHIDETDDPYWHSLELLAEKTIEMGWQAGNRQPLLRNVGVDDALAERVIDKVREAGISVVTNAPINLMLEGRELPHPKPRGIARVKELIEAGSTWPAGRTTCRTCFTPTGRWTRLR